GIAIATGDVLAFTDDDVNVDETWIEAIRAAMHADDAALVGGPVVPRWERRAPWWLALNRGDFGRLAAPLALVDYGLCASDLGPRTLLGANLAVRRNAIGQVGGFAPHLGKLRGTLLSGEDHEFCRRVQAAGLKAFYCPAIRVQHYVPASRTGVRYFVAWFFWSGITNAALDGSRNAQRSFFGVPLFALRRLTVGVAGAFGAALVGRHSAAADCAIDAAFALGYLVQRCGGVR